MDELLVHLDSRGVKRPFEEELDDSAIQEKIDHEVHIRDGIMKLLAACHEEVQALETSKNLLTINARILALMGLLQRHRAKSVMRRKGSSSTAFSVDSDDDDDAPCRAQLSLSDIRVPLMWSQEDHNKTKTEQHLYYVFCLLKLDGQVLDTALVETDESETDVSFDNVIVFDNVSHDFKLDIEIYYSVSAESAANRFSGVKRPLRRTGSGPELTKFILAGHTQLTVDHLNESVKSHDLKTGVVGASPLATTTEGSNMPQLALWGQICCRLAARPECVEAAQMSGFLDLQRRTGSQFSWCQLWCVLRHSTIKCWNRKEDCNNVEPVELIEIKPNMEIADTVSPTFQKRHILILTSLTPEKEPVLASNCEKEYACWRDALRQAIRDVAAWKTACKQEMNIVYPSPKKIPSVETKTLYESVEVTLSCNVHDYLKRDAKRVPLEELKSIPADSAASLECTYDIWQRRVPQNRSFRKGGKKNASTDENSLNYESTI
ncbi:rhotekin-like isoform X2 [Acropora millepora]|uniref:rhotekin-like isoform X2 n=1 Tax=Acropora millepora TaxID=45264 RepID=UPI001CF3D641|nr:rhotekin-like isoform X2 [Acropora millepora]